MTTATTDLVDELRAGVRSLCDRFRDECWQRVDEERRSPQDFVTSLTDAGWLSILIPSEYGDSGLGVDEASVVLEEINASGGSAWACHGQMYVTTTVVRHGSEEQKQRYLPAIAEGRLRLQAFGVTEPDAGSDSTRIRTTAGRTDAGYVINGRKVWTSRLQHSDLFLLLARTTPLVEVRRRTEGPSLFLVDLREAGEAIDAAPIRTLMNHETNPVFVRDLHVPHSALLGQEGQGFRHVLDGMNAERILLAAECVGDGRWFCRRAAEYAGERVVFGRPIGQHQGVQFPIVLAWASVEAADLMRQRAASLFDQGLPCGDKANMAKLLASEASWEAANVCLDTHGAYSFAAEYGVERRFRETLLYRVAPVANNLVLVYLGEHVLGMPKSY